MKKSSRRYSYQLKFLQPALSTSGPNLCQSVFCLHSPLGAFVLVPCHCLGQFWRAVTSLLCWVWGGLISSASADGQFLLFLEDANPFLPSRFALLHSHGHPVTQAECGKGSHSCLGLLFVTWTSDHWSHLKSWRRNRKVRKLSPTMRFKELKVSHVAYPAPLGWGRHHWPVLEWMALLEMPFRQQVLSRKAFNLSPPCIALHLRKLYLTECI